MAAVWPDQTSGAAAAERQHRFGNWFVGDRPTVGCQSERILPVLRRLDAAFLLGNEKYPLVKIQSIYNKYF
jgi:hypothetical protein